LTNVLVTGVSGTGEAVALVELGKRGFRVVKGCARNHVKFHDRFDAVVLLSAPADVIMEQIAQRTTRASAQGTAERDLQLHHLETVESALRVACTHEVDTTPSLDEGVAELIANVNGLRLESEPTRRRRNRRSPESGHGRCRQLSWYAPASACPRSSVDRAAVS
jgi:hypothetical protein